MRNAIASPPGLIAILGAVVLVLWRLSATLLPPALSPVAPERLPIVLATQIAITMIVLVSCLYIILSQKYDTDTEKWAYGAIGLLLGYWLPAG